MSINKNQPKIENINLSSFDFVVNAFSHYATEFCEQMRIDSISSTTENTFSAILKYFYNHFLRASLYTNKIQSNNKQSIINYESAEELENILNVFLFICDSYNKIPSVWGFYCFSGISGEVLESWESAEQLNINTNNSIVFNSSNVINNNISYSDTMDGGKLTLARSKMLKKLSRRRESALSQRLESGGGGVGTIAVLNHCYGWNDTNNTINLSLQVPTISANNLPLLPPKMGNNSGENG